MHLHSHSTVSQVADWLFRASKNLGELSSLGHFLKGSSAALGLTKVKDSCECMQHYGAKKNADGFGTIESEVALTKIKETLARVKQEYTEAEVYLKQ